MPFDITPEKQAGFVHYMRTQIGYKPEPVQDSDLSGKTAIVTGSNCGVGLETARQLLDLGLSTLILAVRDEAKGRTAAAGLRKTTVPDAAAVNIEVWKLDLDVYDTVVAFAEKAAACLKRLDFVILNAGISRSERFVNEHTGHDQVIQVNYLSTALLALLLLPVAKDKRKAQSSPTHMTFTSSEVSAWAKFNLIHGLDGSGILNALDDPAKGYNALDRMMTSKLLGQFLVATLANRVSPEVAIINCASPGAVHDSQFNRDISHTYTGMLVQRFQRLFANTAAVGARMITDAVIKHGEESHGQFLSFGKLVPMAPVLYTEEGANISHKLWEETVQELSFVQPGCILDNIAKSRA